MTQVLGETAVEDYTAGDSDCYFSTDGIDVSGIAPSALANSGVCLCVCVYVFTCFHLWMCMCAVVHVCVCMDVCVCLLLCVFVCCSVCTYVCVCGCVCFFLLFSVKAIMNLWKSLAKRRLIFKNNSSFRIE